jgi:hypothetical protein
VLVSVLATRPDETGNGDEDGDEDEDEDEDGQMGPDRNRRKIGTNRGFRHLKYRDVQVCDALG